MIEAVTVVASLVGLGFALRAYLSARATRRHQERLRDDLERLAREDGVSRPGDL